MTNGHVTVERYALSFTSGALLSREAVIAAPLYLRERDWARVRELIRENNLLQSRTMSSGFRLAREVAQRLAVLTDHELEMLIEATATERGHLMWVAACRRYTFVGDFAEEVVRERFILLTPTLSYDDFDSFVRGKALWHSELAELKESTMQKIRSTLFQMLTEAGLLSERGDILQAVPSERVVDALNVSRPSDVRFLPMIVSERGTR
ncbi:hypothetical protein ABIE21_000476 [Conyzicola nivalis]|uniref:DUF1819 family protein n=1 Tax=Conyzicola nivalis TaxID=1477021 RepID=A0ABV2QIW1_9MICO